MRRRSASRRAGVALSVAALLVLGAAGSPAPRVSRPADLDRWSSADATAYLTDERMATARVWPGSEKSAVVRSGAAGTPSGRSAGPPSVGTLFRVERRSIYFCTASVVSSPGRNLVVTAAHCVTGHENAQRLAFAPGLRRDGSGRLVAPYGLFTVVRDSGRARVWMDGRYPTDKQRYAQYDVAFLQVGPGADHRQVERTVGGNRLWTDTGFRHSGVRLVAYPGADPPPRNCTSGTRPAAFPGWPGTYLRIDCDGYSGGSSGGPFLADFDERTGSGDLIGVIGGYRTGGPTDDISYSAYFGRNIKALYESAVRGVR
ncbi:trypsin-like serine peptidase [Streptomyces sp. DT171]|uniref:trypsin-like serine peptidase n=1 Tax=Streptomyces sp. DT171 TaxID=3416524 RepID=UPI003CF7788A